MKGVSSRPEGEAPAECSLLLVAKCGGRGTSEIFLVSPVPSGLGWGSDFDCRSMSLDVGSATGVATLPPASRHGAHLVLLVKSRVGGEFLRRRRRRSGVERPRGSAGASPSHDAKSPSGHSPYDGHSCPSLAQFEATGKSAHLRFISAGSAPPDPFCSVPNRSSPRSSRSRRSSTGPRD